MAANLCGVSGRIFSSKYVMAAAAARVRTKPAACGRRLRGKYTSNSGMASRPNNNGMNRRCGKSSREKLSRAASTIIIWKNT